MTSQNLDEIYKKISSVVPEIEWKFHAPIIDKINKLKKEKDAVILAHNYQTPEIYHGIADFSADSLALAVEASKTSADIIIMAGVHFMAETAKLMSPDKKVLLPDMRAGCSLSSSITGKDVRLLKEKYLEKNTYYTKGHQFTIDLKLINYCVTLKNQHKTKDVVMLDDYDLPVRIADLESFYTDILDLYQQNLNAYIVEYNKLVQDKGRI